MKLSIITINRNNAAGLQKTIDSVRNQIGLDGLEVEHIIIDGASTDGSVDVIKEYESCIVHCQLSISLKWLSEPDKGIYNAMNKGIKIALNRSESSPHYLQILNSGDILAAPDVCARMAQAVDSNGFPALLYGNMIKKDFVSGRVIGKSRQTEYSLRNYYHSTLNHDCCWIRREAYEQYGLYDETLNVVSDWKWFLMAIGLGQVQPMYVDIDVTIFDASGISETNLALRNQERRKVLESVLPPAILADYDRHAFETTQVDRLRKYHLYGLFYFIERVFFKLEKWRILK